LDFTATNAGGDQQEIDNAVTNTGGEEMDNTVTNAG